MIQKVGSERVQRSKLEICNEILWTLASNGPMKLTQLTTKVELSKSRLERHMRLLEHRELVESQRLVKDQTFYVATERVLKVLNIWVP
jgi:predicted transcriptional regulator